MAKRRKPKAPLAPLLIDDRGRPDEAWIPAHQKPTNTNYGWSGRMIVCQFTPGDFRPTMLFASYDFRRDQWHTTMGPVENVTYWQYPPEFPKEYRT